MTDPRVELEFQMYQAKKDKEDSDRKYLESLQDEIASLKSKVKQLEHELAPYKTEERNTSKLTVRVEPDILSPGNWYWRLWAHPELDDPSGSEPTPEKAIDVAMKAMVGRISK